MSSALLISDTHGGHSRTLTLNRIEVRNALDEALIADMTQAIVSITRDPSVRAIILTGAGDSFCAGTDVGWMQGLDANAADNDARRFGNLLLQIRNSPKPIIARINGPAIGAGAALVAAADIAIADEAVSFAFPAVRLGVVPAVIAPFLVEAMGPSEARRLMLTGESFSALEARRHGLAHMVGVSAHLDAMVDQVIDHLLLGGPDAVRETKALLNGLGQAAPCPAVIDDAAKLSARIRRRDEAKEGLAAFTQGRAPNWTT